MGESTTLYVVYLTGPFGFFLAHKSKQEKKQLYVYMHTAFWDNSVAVQGGGSETGCPLTVAYNSGHACRVFGVLSANLV